MTRLYARWRLNLNHLEYAWEQYSPMSTFHDKPLQVRAGKQLTGKPRGYQEEAEPRHVWLKQGKDREWPAWAISRAWTWRTDSLSRETLSRLPKQESPV